MDSKVYFWLKHELKQQLFDFQQTVGYVSSGRSWLYEYVPICATV